VDVGSGLSPGLPGRTLRKNRSPPEPRGRFTRAPCGSTALRGVIVYRMADHVERPTLIGSAVIEPLLGARVEPPAFLFSLSYRMGKELSDRLRAGETLRVRAEVDAETRAGHYSQVHAVLKGTEPELPEVWVQAHTNHRNTGGGNNLTGLGATLDLARSLSTLVAQGRLERPRRSIRFTWGPEHMAIIYYLNENPAAVSRILAYLNLDMVGDHQVLSESVLRLYRTPSSLPSFLNDVVEEMFDVVGRGTRSPFGRAVSLSRGFSLRSWSPREAGRSTTTSALLGAERSRGHRGSEPRNPRGSVEHLARPLHRHPGRHSRSRGRDPDEARRSHHRCVRVHPRDRFGRRRPGTRPERARESPGAACYGRTAGDGCVGPGGRDRTRGLRARGEGDRDPERVRFRRLAKSVCRERASGLEPKASSSARPLEGRREATRH
jgi:hypothetical protein